MNDLDVLLRDALTTDAERAPHLPDEWVGPTTATIVPLEPRRRTRPLMVAVGAVAATAAAAAGLALVTRPDSPPAPAASTAPAWQPPGEEFPSVDLGPVTQSTLGPTVAALTRAVAVEGHPPLELTTVLQYQGSDTADVLVCTSEATATGCRDGRPGSPLTWTISITSSIENKVALDTNLWMLEGVTPDAAYVTYVDGDVQLWQRPIAGLVAFPDIPGRDEVAVAYDAAGAELARYTLAALGSMSDSVDVPLQADLTVAEFAAITDLTSDAMTGCLGAAGGTSSTGGGVHQFAAEVDQSAVWADCVATTQAAVAAEIEAIEPRFFDPVTEMPLAEPSAYAPG